MWMATPKQDRFHTIFSNYFVASISQNKSFAQLDVFLLILCFYRFFGSICGGIWRFFYATESTANRSFALIAHESTKVGTKHAGCGNKTIFSALRWLIVSDEKMTSPDHLGVSVQSSKIVGLHVFEYREASYSLSQTVFRANTLNIYLLLAECEVRTASYGPSFFLPFMAQARSARAMKTRREKTRIRNLPYGPSKRG